MNHGTAMIIVKMLFNNLNNLKYFFNKIMENIFIKFSVKIFIKKINIIKF